MNSPHVVSIKLYATIFGALLLLTIATAGAAFVDLGGELNSIVALSIAVVKTLLVLLFFMHVRYSSRPNVGLCRRRIVLAIDHDDPDHERRAHSRDSNALIGRKPNL
jgi:caa(3)-type oxidase subunit IV